MRKLYQLDQQQLKFIRSQRKHAYLEDTEFVPYPRVPKLADYLEQWGPDNVRTPAHVWKDSIALAREWSSRLGSYLEVRYEDIVADPRQQMARIFEFCELPSIRADNQKFWDKINTVGHTRHKNNYVHFDIIESICHEEMKALGYL
jgi:hypothetical protein